MSYGPRIQQKAPPKSAERDLFDIMPPFQPPSGCEAPPPGAFTLYAFEVAEAKVDPVQATRSMSLDGPSVVFGRSQTIDGQVHDGHKTVSDQHCCLYFMKGAWYIKAINGTTYVESMTLHPYLCDTDGVSPKRYTSASSRKIETIQPMDPRRKLTREVNVFRCGESDRRFWVAGPLPVGKGEIEEASMGDTPGRDRKRGERHEKEKDRHEREHHEGSRRERERPRSRSRGHGRRK